MDSSLCAVPECDRPAVSKGWCDPHYRRWRKTGETPQGPVIERTRKACSVAGCGRLSESRGLCGGHYQRWIKSGKTPTELLLTDKGAPRCSVEGCDRPAKSKGWCHGHYMRWWYTKEEPTGPLGRKRSTAAKCAVEDCARTASIGDLCSPHGRRMQRNGHPGPAGIREVAGHGKGRVRYVDGGGYVRVKAPGHPNAYSTGRILEHVLVMSEKLGRPLVKGENVHHKNGNRADNRPENLELWVTNQPKGQRVPDLLAWAREIIERYEGVDIDSVS